MEYNVYMSSNYDTMKFSTEDQKGGLIPTLVQLLLLYVRSESTKAMTISIFPVVDVESVEAVK